MRCLVSLAVLAACSGPHAASTPPPTRAKTAAPSRPTIVDSHVHLAFYQVADQLAEHGVRAAVDLAAPERALGKKYPLIVIQSGPMLTRPGGYPLDCCRPDPPSPP